MKKSVLMVFCMMIFCLSRGLASPPVSISLSYDTVKGSLHMDAVHPSFDLNKSYVRLINIYVNGNQVSSLNYYRQNDYNSFSDDVPLTAQVGDVIKVEMFCTLGGSLSQELTVKASDDKQATDQGGDSGNAGSTGGNSGKAY
jgi:hypothetical protein